MLHTSFRKESSVFVLQCTCKFQHALYREYVGEGNPAHKEEVHVCIGLSTN